MIFKLKIFLSTAITLLALVSTLNADSKMTMLPGEVTNFELPRFDEKTGNKQWELFGKKAKFLGEEKIDVSDMKLILFDKSTNKVRVEISSASAQVNITTKVVVSDNRLFVKGDEFDLSGKKWQWNGDKSIVDIYNDVVVNFTPSKERSSKKTKSNGVSFTAQKTSITGDSARLENSSKENKFYVVGNAKVRSENLKVDCNTLTAITGDSQGQKSEGDISLIDAKGGVVLVRDNRMAKADHAIILPREDEAVLSGKPEIVDISSKAKLSGHKIFFIKETSSIKTTSTNDIRAKAIFFHTDKDGKSQKIEITSNEILMSNEQNQNKVLFNGHVNVKSDDFSAECSKIEVFVKNVEAEKPEIKIIKCMGGVLLKNENGTARSWVMDIIPSEEKTQLRGNVKLVNSKDGTTLNSEILTLYQKENRGNASAKKNDFVVLTIPEETASSATDLQSSIKKTTTVKNKKKSSGGNAIIKSRSIDFVREDNSGRFTFNNDVSINSKSATASCQQMIVYCVAKKGKSSEIVKIEAFDNVKVVQNEYTAMAESAVIYPRVDNSQTDAQKKVPHKFVELLVWDKKPNVRPKIMLPPMKNMGFDDSSTRSTPKHSKMTVIVSDRQWLTSLNDTEKYFFEGNVKLTSTDAQGSCDKIEVLISQPNRVKRREIAEITLSGNVQMQQDLKEITCGKVKIYTKDEVAVLSENPVVFNREDNTRAAGAKIIYNRGTKIVSIQGDTQEAPDEFSDVENARPKIVLPQFSIKNRK